MYKFLGYMKGNRRLQPKAIKKLELTASKLIEKNPPQLNVDRYLVTVGEYKYYGISFQLQAYYYDRQETGNFEKMRFFLFNNGKKEIVLYLKNLPEAIPSVE